MSESKTPLPQTPGSLLDDEEVARVIASAGLRAPIPAEDLETIAAAARATWRERMAAQAPPPATEPAAPELPPGSPASAAPDRADAASERERPSDLRRFARGRSGRSGAPVPALLALAAALVGIVLGLRGWLQTREDVAPAAAAVRVAAVEAVRGEVAVGVGGGEHPLAVGAEVPAGSVIRTAAADPAQEMPAAHAALRTETGVALRLAAGTAVRLAAVNRVELLAGALYADTDEPGWGQAVASAPAAPALEIVSEAGTARDIGTRFVARLVDGPALEIAVRDGAVTVESKTGGSELATEGDRLLVRADGGVVHGEVPLYGDYWTWVLEAAGGFDIEGRTVGDLLDWVTRETGWRVAFENEELEAAARARPWGGGGEALAGLRADQAAFTLLPGAGLEASLDGGVLTVRPLL